MPLFDQADPAAWDALYNLNADGKGNFKHFERASKERLLGDSHWLLRDALGLVAGQRIALIGGGFGWIAEDWAAAGLGPIAVVDTSTYIQTRKAQNAILTIYNEDVSTVSGRRAIKQALGGTNVTVDWAITEDVLPVLSDAECLQLCGVLRNFATNVAHWVTADDGTGGHVPWPPLNWKTALDWKMLVAPDRVVVRGYGVTV